LYFFPQHFVQLLPHVLGKHCCCIATKKTYKQSNFSIFQKKIEDLCGFFKNKEHQNYIIIFENEIHFFGEDK